jgi:hypothetical protein
MGIYGSLLGVDSWLNGFLLRQSLHKKEIGTGLPAIFLFPF